MIVSMTGFAAAGRESDAASVSVTLRSVNHRHLDVQFRMPAYLAAVELELRNLISRQLSRGRVDVAVSVQSRQLPVVEVELNEPVIAALDAAMGQARARGLVSGALLPGDLLRVPQALSVREQAADPESVARETAPLVKEAIEAAIEELQRMRATEGDHLRADLDTRRALVADLVERVAVAADEGRVALEQRLEERISHLRSDLQVDESTVAQEIVRWAARSDISEEVARFRAHVSHWQTLADAPEPCGRKLDFLLQEMNREVNTMGSKADGLRVSELIIAAKAELEKMREQVQNVE
jgi:uncharacterized protein (TIGR00255 family)